MSASCSRQLSGKVVVITGAHGGIGSCVASYFAATGATLMLGDIHPGVEQQAAGLGAEGHQAGFHIGDISDPAIALALAGTCIDLFGRIDVLVHAAGLDAPRGNAWEEDENHWRRIIDTNLSGAWWCSRAVIPRFIEQKSGRIIYIGSDAARRGVAGLSVAYNASKAGLSGLTIGLAKQLEPHGILVNTVAPGPTGNTGDPLSPADIERANKLYPLGFGGAEPVAHACLYLAGESGNWVSGTVLNVSGGRVHG